MRYILLSCLAIMMCTCQAATTIPSGSESRTVHPQQGNIVASRESVIAKQDFEGHFYGISDNQFGQRAWLLRLDPQTGKGSLYMPPGKLDLSHVEVSPTGRLTFRSAVGLGDVTYSYDGQHTSSGIKGLFRLTRTQPSNEDIGSANVTLRKLDTQLVGEKRITDISGLYSNIKYNEEGGDLIGEELILIPDSSGLKGIFTSYQNEMLPYAVVNLKQSGGQVQFLIRTANGEESYHGIFSAEKITLWSSDVNADREAGPMVLLKRKSLLEILVTAART